MKTKEELGEAITGYKEIIFGSDTPGCVAYLDQLRKRQVIDQKKYDKRLMEDMVKKLAWEGLQKNIVMDCGAMIDGRTGEVLDPELDSTYWKDKF